MYFNHLFGIENSCSIKLEFIMRFFLNCRLHIKLLVLLAPCQISIRVIYYVYSSLIIRWYKSNGAQVSER